MRTPKESMVDEIVNELANQFDIDMHLAQNVITVAVEKYTITQTTTELTVYHGQENISLIKKFIVCKRVAGCSSKTLKYYQATLKFFFKRVNKRATEVNTDDVRVYLAFREMRDHVSASMRDNDRRILSSFFTWMRKEGLRTDNPIETIGPIKKAKKKKKAFSEMDVEWLRIACETPRDKFIIEFLLSTGCRVSEFSQILISDLEGDQVLVHGKGSKDRYVFLNAKAQIAMKNYMAYRREKFGDQDINPYLLRPELNGPAQTLAPVAVSGIEIAVRRIGKKAEVENVHPHRFRRTCATWALRKGMPVELVSLMLGHEKIETTQIYLDIDEDNLRTSHKKYVTG